MSWLLSPVFSRGPSSVSGVRENEGPVVAGLRLRWREVRAPRRGGARDEADEVAFGLWEPDSSLDALLDELTPEEFLRDDERMPYFGTVWPAAESLAARLLTGPRLEGKRALDLGCGLGACGFAAAARGASVTFFDWEPRAILIAAASSREPEWAANSFDFVVGDWREPPPCGPFDLVLGADVLYEARNGPAVAAFLAGHLKPGGEAWIADPGRPHAQPFPALAQAEGLELLGCEILPPEPHGLEITLLRLGRPR